MRVAGYCRVSTADQALGLSLEWQERKLLEECQRRDWTLEVVDRESASGKNLRGRPVLSGLLAALDAGAYDALMVARLDRLSRSVPDCYEIMGKAAAAGWSLVSLDPQVDTTSPFGRAMAGVAAIFAQLERELIAQRQRESVAARKAAGTHRVGGNALPILGADVSEAIARLRRRGVRWADIPRRLAIEGYEVPDCHPRTFERAAKRAA